MDSTRSTLIAAMVIVAACSPPVSTTSAPTKTDFLRANIDTTVDPAQDFFQYANGGWVKRKPIPHSQSAWGIGNIVREQLYFNLRSINQQAAGAAKAAAADPQKIGDISSTANGNAK